MGNDSIRHKTIWLVGIAGVGTILLHVLNTAIYYLPLNQPALAVPQVYTIHTITYCLPVFHIMFTISLILHLVAVNRDLAASERLLELSKHDLLKPLDESHVLPKRQTADDEERHEAR